jgi:hypothetical protein
VWKEKGKSKKGKAESRKGKAEREKKKIGGAVTEKGCTFFCHLHFDF